ncbi:hypothetical protein [Schlesneria sp.]|uniref:hypothetical protein n=1 Tax=Schlesneria sp. TaxID=2762018 RepID=UPI002F07E3B6
MQNNVSARIAKLAKNMPRGVYVVLITACIFVSSALSGGLAANIIFCDFGAGPDKEYYQELYRHCKNLNLTIPLIVIYYLSAIVLMVSFSAIFVQIIWYVFIKKRIGRCLAKSENST